MTRIRSGNALTLLLLLTFANPGQAHLMPQGRGNLNITANGVYLVLAIPTTTFHHLDSNRDGGLSAGEFDEQRALIGAQLESHLWLEANGERYTPRDLLLSLDHAHRGEDVQSVTLLCRFAVDAPIEELSFGVDYRAINPGPLRIQARSKPLGRSQPLTLSAQQHHGPLRWL